MDILINDDAKSFIKKLEKLNKIDYDCCGFFFDDEQLGWIGFKYIDNIIDIDLFSNQIKAFNFIKSS
jgi:hypothetical protein